jgi:uncharacterized membrane protein
MRESEMLRWTRAGREPSFLNAATGDSNLEGANSDAAPSAETPSVPRTTLQTDRLEAFSDGVFAVAITLLVFGITAPRPARPGQYHLAADLGAQWPLYVTYVVSFLTIGIIWVNHHGTFARVRTVDRPLLFINLLLLMTVALIPFPTNLLGIYIQRGGMDARVAAAVYGATMTAMSICFVATWAYAVYGRLVDFAQMDERRARASVPRFGVGVAIYAATIGIAFLSPYLDLLIFGLIAVFYVFDQQTM